MKPHEQRDRGGRQLRQHRHGHGGPLAAHAEPGLDVAFESIDIVLELAGEKLPDFRVDTVQIGHQGQQAS